MKVQVLSDLHLEFHPDAGKSYVDELDPEGIDVLVLAGDICTSRTMLPSMGAICKRYSESRVIWVHGNHEFYGSDRRTILNLTSQCMKENENLICLDNDIVEIDGQRFIGAPMWFKHDESDFKLEACMMDFRVIKGGFRHWVQKQNKITIKFFEENVQPSDIVITHHMPSNRSTAPRFVGSELNQFFVCCNEGLITNKGPKIWIHGHTHDSCDYVIEHTGNTKETTHVVCNPRGYWPHDLNPDFDKDLVLEV